MAGFIRYCATFIAIIAIVESRPLSVDYYTAYKELEQALLSKNTSSISNIDIIVNTFFPKRAPEPLCAIVKYTLISVDDLTNDTYTFLWTASYLPYATSVLLLSYSQSGISLKGFDWEKSCLIKSETQLVLEINSFNYSLDDVVFSALEDLTSQLKAYAEAGGVPKVSSSYRGYSLKWDNREDKLNILFTAYIVLLNIFIVSSALVSSNFLYKGLYDNIKDKAMPGYAFFWAIVFLSIVWNVGPSWLVLSTHGYNLYFSLAVVMPLLLLVAMLIKKNPKFPIPGRWWNGNHSDRCTGDSHSFRAAIFLCARCLFSHIIQVISIWSLLITFMFFIHYLTSVIVSMYLDPLNSLVKVAFVKAIVVCFIITTALIFVVDSAKFEMNKNALQKVFLTFFSLLTIFCALPILIVFLVMIGGIVFDESLQSNSWKPIFTLIPSGLLLLASWFSHGILFPKGRKDADPLKEIEDDLEGKPAKSASPASEDASNNTAHTQMLMNEATPLVAHPA